MVTAGLNSRKPLCVAPLPSFAVSCLSVTTFVNDIMACLRGIAVSGSTTDFSHVDQGSKHYPCAMATTAAVYQGWVEVGDSVQKGCTSRVCVCQPPPRAQPRTST